MTQGTSSRLAIAGGRPVREELLPYGRHTIDDDDVAAVVASLRSGWLTTGPKISEFEKAFAKVVGASDAVALSSGTAALHVAIHSLDLEADDEVLVPALTFVATANAVLYCGGKPVFVDIRRDDLLIDPDALQSAVTPRTRAILAVDFAGHPCDYDRLLKLANEQKLTVVADSCHALGATYGGRAVGSLVDLTVFSLHPVKHITTGEGGMVTVDDPSTASRLRRFRNHGIDRDHHSRSASSSWLYDMVELGFNYRISDLQCALGTSQLRKLEAWIEHRRAMAKLYDEALDNLPKVRPLSRSPAVEHAYHLYVVELIDPAARQHRGEIFAALRAEGIGVNVHYRPVYLHSHYRRLGFEPGLCPIAEEVYEGILSLPIHHGMTEADAQDVVVALEKVLAHSW
ncbi:MAG TPA: UDP-4-amino-4,6-dideoxy-N-acetyl-beta-L-altrosamine transaminase [Thermoanaerobaculia bacterium]|nr:UDP-4-amino-4,6-dideoxy-N-acetyl-beta-L-altrosamine transaminase [Thermoanaerobaculia bacterium]